MSADKQLAGISAKTVREKIRNGEALNAKELTVAVDYCYTTVRAWFGMQGFPVLSGKVFFEDFVIWRRRRLGLESCTDTAPPRDLNGDRNSNRNGIRKSFSGAQLPPKAQRLLTAA